MENPQVSRPVTASFLIRDARNAELKRLVWLLLIPLGLLLPRIFVAHPAFVERVYTQNIYPVFNTVLRTVFGIFPFSFAEFLLYALAILVPGTLFARLMHVLMGRTGWIRLLHLIISYAILFGIVLNSYYLVWAFNYSRPPIDQLLSLDMRARSEEELTSLCLQLADAAVILREQVQEDENGVFTYTNGLNACLTKVPGAYANLGKDFALFRLPAARPKPVWNNDALSWAGIAGIFFGFTAEPNVNVGQPPLLVPSAAAHECAHSLGFARENEANFVSYLACQYAADPAIRYSGVMLALINCGNQLHDANADAYEELRARYSEAMERDLAQYTAYWERYEGEVEETVSQINDNYLKHNQQESGVKSYGEMVDLLLAWTEKYGLRLPAA